MRGSRLIPIIVLAFIAVGLVVFSADGPVNAQGENIIVNSGFEGIYESYTPESPQEQADCPMGICTTAQVPWGWKPWWIKERPTDVNPEFKPAETSAAGNRVNSGQRAAQYFSFWSTHKAGLRQTIPVPANSVVVFTILGQAWMTESDTSLVSDRSGTVNMRVGIDPTGGGNPYSPSIVWSGYQQPFDAYQQFSVQAQAQGESVTVFTFSAPSVNPNSPDYGFKHNDIYWDDASLTVAGAGSPGPVSQPSSNDSGNSSPVTQPRYVPGPTATPNAEGIIFVEVQSGDSLWAISARAGLQIDEFLVLNEIARDHIIRAGDILIIGFGDPPGSEPDIDGGSDESEGSSAEASASEASETSASETSASEEESRATPPPIPTISGPSLVVQDVEGGTICLSAFDDLDKDTNHDESEPLRPAVAITISDGEQVVSNYITDGKSEPFCIQGLDDGNYRVTRSSLPDESLTTPGDYAVAVASDVTVNVAFGSFLSENVLVSSALESGSSGGLENGANASEEGTFVDGSDDAVSTLVIVGVAVVVLLLGGIVILVLSNRRSTES